MTKRQCRKPSCVEERRLAKKAAKQSARETERLEDALAEEKHKSSQLKAELHLEKRKCDLEVRAHKKNIFRVRTATRRRWSSPLDALLPVTVGR